MKFLYIYNSETGEFSKRGDDGQPVVVATGYSGYGTGRNNPALEDKKSQGPIPRGHYMIGQPHFSDNVGPVCFHLSPVGHSAKGRTALMIHGDNSTRTASRGCVILPRPIRDEISREWQCCVNGGSVLGLEVV